LARFHPSGTCVTLSCMLMEPRENDTGTLSSLLVKVNESLFSRWGNILSPDHLLQSHPPCQDLG
jgi:hypothetical protein